MMQKKIKWTFPDGDAPTSLPDPDKILTFPGSIVKQNPVRSVRRVADPTSGDVYYIKQDSPRSFLKKVRGLICSKSKREFLAAAFLREQGIPVIRYEALGECGSESCLISKELKGFCSAAQFWYSLPADPFAASLRERFITALTALLKRMNQNHILHPDFHLGNLMCMPDAPEKLLLPDPYGIRKTWFRKAAEFNSIVITNLAAEITPGQGREILQATGAAPELWDILLQQNRKMIDAQWDRRKQQILSGNSKFCRTTEIDGKKYVVRNSRWFTPVEFDPAQYKQIVMPYEQAIECWLGSFRKEMLYETDQHPAAVCIIGNDAVLFYNID